jgi:rhamnogalacturonyl hydrolase YesR
MKKKFILLLLLAASGMSGVKAQDLPDKKETLATVTKVNDYFMKKFADYRTPSFVRGVTRPSNIWTRGVYYEGLMALYAINPLDTYYDYAKGWADYHEWGFRGGTTTRKSDLY